MIFDSVEMQHIREKYAGAHDFQVPRIVLLDRATHLSGERAYLEQLVESTPPPQQNRWLGDLLSENDEQHLGAWFEVMLYGWLEGVGTVEAGPQIEGNDPDFLVEIDDRKVVVEAKAILISREEREHDKREAEILWALRQIREPYLVHVRELDVHGPLDTTTLIVNTTTWLEISPHDEFVFQDLVGNRVTLEVLEFVPSYDRLRIMVSGPVKLVDPGRLKPHLQKKAKQHQAIRRAGYPYILAVLLEDASFSAYEVMEAWLGRQQIVIDQTTLQPIEERNDLSGLHFFKSKIMHTTVSGTLVFHSRWDEGGGRHALQGSFLQNPYARIPIEPFLFPTTSHFVVVDSHPDKGFHQMAWRYTTP